MNTPNLYDKSLDKDSCGIGFIASIKGQRKHEIVKMALDMLARLEHRGACGCDPLTGDGAGILTQLPHALLKKVQPGLPEAGDYALGMLFLPLQQDQQKICKEIVERITKEEGQTFLAWRQVPVKETACGPMARQVMPSIWQFFVQKSDNVKAGDDFERKLYVLRKRIEHDILNSKLQEPGDFYVCSLSSQTVVYKGQLTSWQVPQFFADLTDQSYDSAIALVHSRFSTNTFPSWKRAHPYRYIIHNGEINTVRGNVNWMRAREKMMQSEAFGKDIEKLFPVVDEDGSDSSMFDNALELLLQTGRSLPQAMMMMIPEAWQKNDKHDPSWRAFFEYHACLMEPWDGPASIGFTDGKVVGACLDRNGLRPSRYVVTKDDLVVLSSESGVIEFEPENILTKGRLHPGKMFLVDTVAGRIVSNDELKNEMSALHPYGQWLKENLVHLKDLPAPKTLPESLTSQQLLHVQRQHGYTVEDLKVILAPMALNGQEPVGSMGIDTPLAVLSEKPQLLFNYFKQLFAQVTNPPIDPLREDMVMSLETTIGSEQNIFTETPQHCHQIKLLSPSLSDEEFAKIREIKQGKLCSATLSAVFKAQGGAKELEKAIEQLCQDASAAIEKGAQILILSDRTANKDYAAIPSLLATAAVHHHLIRTGDRTKVGIVVESAEPREVMHFCLLAGYGAGAWHPYGAYETVRELIREGIVQGHSEEESLKNYRKAIDKGVLKVGTKMGISTLQSYRGAQIFEAIGLQKEFVEKYFTRTPSRIQGIGLDVVAQETLMRHAAAFAPETDALPTLEVGGRYQWRRRGERHLLNPDTVSKLQYAVRANNAQSYKEYSDLINEQSKHLMTLRGLLSFKNVQPISIDEVEPASEIVKRFATGAMSLGSISRESHETLAIAMNRIGGKSNTGEGGEDPERFVPDSNGDLRRSSIKQVASGRFGVTIGYLANSDDIQIKIAQGAKPGEGGQLPGHKVDAYIAKTRYSVEGVGLISPPPHHDIYSIEDIAQLIHDLKNANPRARIHVKLVSEVGVGTVAAGVVKAKSDVVLISGYDGGTGASPLTSIQHAGGPWELGLAETQQVLVANGLRGRCVVQTDGKLQTGRDVAIAAMLGAEEFGFATTPLVAMGCIMMRVCHLNTCPVGIATQDPVLRKKFAGKPEHVINYFFFVAEELRQIMAQLGFKTVKEMVGRVDKLEVNQAIEHYKAKGVDLSAMLALVENKDYPALHNIEAQDHGLDKALDNELIAKAKDAIEDKKPVRIESKVQNFNRCVGTMLSGTIGQKYGDQALPEGTLHIKLNGSAGQSLGAFLCSGVTIEVEGDANDYCGKGLSGGRIAVYPPKASTFVAADNIITGNVALYGATSGQAYFCGVGGERFAVRNSGATAVIEGVGDHGCEYMTKGLVAVLGETGRNFAAGMSGGIAYVLDENKTFTDRCNLGMVELVSLTAADQDQLRAMIEAHVKYTSSLKGKTILENWKTMVNNFVKVLPTDYKKILEKQHLDSEAMKLASV